MKLLNRLLGLGLLTLSLPGIHAANIRDVRAALEAPASLLPESFETDTKKMLEDWYLKNYVVLDYDADDYDPVNVTDEVLIERLSALPTIIEMPLNVPVRNAINFYVNRKRQLVENMLGLSLYYLPIFEAALERHGMPNELRYLPVIESALVPTAVSKAGAAGLWQFMPGTATDLGLEVNSLIDQRRDPYISSDAAARYLKQLYNIYGDWSLAIAAYNCGPGNVNKALRRAGEGKHDFWEIYPFLPSETRGYVPAFIAANYVMQYHKHHDISPALARRPIVVDTVHVHRRVHFEQISEVMDIPIEEIRALNPQFRQDIIPGDIRPYSLVLPSLQTLAYIVNEDSIVNHNAAKYARRGRVEPASGATTGRDAKGEYYDEEVIKYHTVKKGETLAKIASKYGITVAQIRKYNKVGKTVKQGKKLKIVSTVRRYKLAAPAETTTTTTQAPTPIEIRSKDVKDNSPAAVDTTATTIPADTTATGADEVANAFATESSDTIQAADNVAAASDDVPESVRSEVADAVSSKASSKNNKGTSASSKNSKSTSKASNDKSVNKKTTTHTVRRGESLGKIAARYGVTVAQLKRANNMAGDKIQVGQKLKIPSK